MRRTWRLALPWLLLLAVGVATLVLRFGLIESSAVGELCSGRLAPWWCQWRAWLVFGFLHQIYGVLALLATAIAMFSRRPALAWLSAALGAFALQLYCVEPGALALLLGCLRLLRLQADTRRAPAEQHRQRQQHVQAQP